MNVGWETVYIPGWMNECRMRNCLYSRNEWMKDVKLFLFQDEWMKDGKLFIFQDEWMNEWRMENCLYSRMNEWMKDGKLFIFQDEWTNEGWKTVYISGWMNEGWETVYIFWKKEISMVQHFLTIGIILNLKLVICKRNVSVGIWDSLKEKMRTLAILAF